MTITVGSNGQTALERFLGCLMIAVMPQDGLEEALHSLRDMLEFYKRPPTPQRVQLKRAPLEATVVDRRKRPDLVIG